MSVFSPIKIIQQFVFRKSLVIAVSIEHWLCVGFDAAFWVGVVVFK